MAEREGERQHVTYRSGTVQKALEMLNRLGVDHECDRQTDGREGGQTDESHMLISRFRSNQIESVD